MTTRDILLTLCLFGGLAGIVYGASRRDAATALLGLIVTVIALGGLA